MSDVEENRQGVYMQTADTGYVAGVERAEKAIIDWIARGAPGNGNGSGLIPHDIQEALIQGLRRQKHWEAP